MMNWLNLLEYADQAILSSLLLSIDTYSEVNQIEKVATFIPQLFDSPQKQIKVSTLFL